MVLALPQPLHLFQDPGCPVESFIPGKPYRWLALLYTNRQISEEARAALYRFNSFTFQEVENGSVLEAFINSIGHSNAGSLSHLCFDFPSTESMHGEISLRECSLQRLQLLQKECSSLAKLEILIHSRNSRLLIEQDSSSVRGVLSEINRQLGYISSLGDIIVRVYSGSPAPSVKEFLQGLGWIVSMGDK
jgi:hypothetical protein